LSIILEREIGFQVETLVVRFVVFPVIDISLEIIAEIILVMWLLFI